MALDSTAQPHSNCNPSFYAFGSSSSPHHQADLEINGQVGFHRLTKGNAPQFLRLHQMMHGGGGGAGDSNDGSLISFEDSFEAAAGGYHNSTSRRPNDSHQTASSLDSHILAMYSSDDHHKHPNMDDEKSYMPPNKKQCTNNKSKAKPVASKDPQSIAAKNRRERISERLKILQELVPNGTKVDLVTMLEKAIGYVKFLQLQVKVLAADEFWPVQGGKAPELSQVKDAIDAILSSQRSDRNSASN